MDDGRGSDRSCTFMNIHFERSGGFAGLRLSHDVNSETLPPDQGAELNRLVESSDFFHLPKTVSAATPGGDRFQYKLTVKSGPTEHTVALDEAAVPEKLRPLLNWLTTNLRNR